MKIRSSFVANSSSSSFILNTAGLSQDKIDMLYNHINIANEKKWDQFDNEDWTTGDEWESKTLTENCSGKLIRFSTWMDNFDLIEFARQISKIPAKNIFIEY